MKKTVLKEGFAKVFKKEPEILFFSPGRINLIGEHTDYNGGHVFPCAVNLGTYGAATKRNDRKIRFFSANFEELGILETTLDSLDERKKGEWINYPKGMILELLDAGYEINSGADLYFDGDLPNGAGLSSSASIELLTGAMINALFGLNIEMLDLVKFGQKTENNYVGVDSGIMDQFAVGMGRDNQAILLDTNTLDYAYADIDLGDNVIVIMNTNKKRKLEDSKYNERRQECESALEDFKTVLDIKTLGDLSIELFDEYNFVIKNSVERKRARHAVFENQRTLQAKKALDKGNLETFGHLMNASHVSLEDDYEVTGIELDTLVHTAWQQSGVLGARMTGAGFGGCAIALVDGNKVDEFKEKVGSVYKEKIGYAPSFYIAQIATGTKVLD
ncbi:galactokinase [Liquorilactobacillus cacaonum]|uniref:Galactokinase n=1 Tax=Liquorilactobacillus cacaonum DSM 21116 TaxID=1423729 RepID=A0A0R2CK24_9LACO|nr:galactokinase [Liquorilactobacillus cacaonum]KRM91999.1 galactokinase (galactose kinase) [Liquorilactobacillus cacaonum DSM 21116]